MRLVVLCESYCKAFPTLLEWVIQYKIIAIRSINLGDHISPDTWIIPAGCKLGMFPISFSDFEMFSHVVWKVVDTKGARKQFQDDAEPSYEPSTCPWGAITPSHRREHPHKFCSPVSASIMLPLCVFHWCKRQWISPLLFPPSLL